VIRRGRNRRGALGKQHERREGKELLREKRSRKDFLKLLPLAFGNVGGENTNMGKGQKEKERK
jgi:hypothetical protein